MLLWLRMDYVIFFCGMGIVLLGSACLALRMHGDGLLPWRSVGAASRLQAVAMPAVILAVAVAGWFYANAAGAAAKRDHLAQMLSACRVAAVSLDPDLARRPDSTRSTGPVDARLRTYLQSILRLDGAYRRIYLAEPDGGRVIFTADSEPAVYRDHTSLAAQRSGHPDELGQVFSGARTECTAEYRDAWGEWVSALAPVRDRTTGRVTAVLGMDEAQQRLLRQISSDRLAPVIIALLLAALLLGCQAVYAKQTAGTERIRARYRRFEGLESGSPDCLCFLDARGAIISINDAGSSGLGLTEDQAVGTPMTDLWRDDCRATVASALATALGGSVSQFTAVAVRPSDGHEITWLVALNPLLDDCGNVVGLAGIWTDITEIARLRDEATEQNTFLNTLLDSLPNPVFYKDANGVYTGCNRAFEEIIGRSRHEIVGKTVRDVWTPETAAIFEEADQKLLRSPGLQAFESSIVTGGDVRSVIFTKATFADQEGGVLGLVGSITDITERKRVEETLRQSEERFDQLARQSRTVTWEVDAQGLYTYISRVCESVIGCRPEDVIGKKHFCDLHPQKGLEAFRASASAVFESRDEMRGLVNPAQTLDGGIVWLSTNAIPMLDQDGRLKGYRGTHTDITERVRMETLLAEEREWLATTLRSIGDGVIAVDTNACVTFLNPVAEVMTGWSSGDAMGTQFSDVFNVVYESTRERMESPVSRVLRTGEPVELQNHAVLISRQGNEYHVADSCAPIRGANGAMTGVVLVFRDVSERRSAEVCIRLQAAALNAADDLIVIADQTGQAVFANESFQEQTGLSEAEIAGQNLREWLTGTDGSSAIDAALCLARSGASWSGEMLCRSHGEPLFTADVTIAPLSEGDEATSHIVLVARNVTEKKAYENMLDYQAHHDALTGLPNRLFFSEELCRFVAGNCSPCRKSAVLFIDLDKFKLVNDTLGHHIGDTILVEAAARLSSCIRDGDLLARMGGDEFTALLRNLQSPRDAADVAERMLARISSPFRTGGTRLVIGASIGISIYPDNAKDQDGLLKSADTAMYHAKELGRHNYQFFSEELHLANKVRLETERDLRTALKRGELKVYFQPIVSTETMQIAGGEALLRWDHPGKGMVSPALFIPVAEETGLIVEIGRMVLKSACARCQEWRGRGYGDFVVSVNASPVQLRRQSFADEVLSVLSETGLPPDGLNLEITETVLAKNEYGEMATLNRLRDYGIMACLDDFGVGYSSLSRLKKFPVVHMKVDGAFVRDIEHDQKDQAMTQSIVAMAHSLGIRVTAEWVENEEQMAVVRSVGCDLAQGYLISPPLPAEQFERLLDEWSEGHRQRLAA